MKKSLTVSTLRGWRPTRRQWWIYAALKSACAKNMCAPARPIRRRFSGGLDASAFLRGRKPAWSALLRWSKTTSPPTDCSAGADSSVRAARSSTSKLPPTVSRAGAETVSRESDLSTARTWIVEAFDALTEREQLIIRRRKLKDDPDTLEYLGRELGLSKERVRQLEAQALRKMRTRMETEHGAEPSTLAATMA